MNDVKKETLQEIAEVFDGELTEKDVKDIVYSAYAYSTRVDDTNINDVKKLLAYIDWEHFLKFKETYGRLPVTEI